MVKDLTKLKWEKDIYYVSDDVIFEISKKKLNPDLDSCGTYLIDFAKASDTAKKAKDGAVLNLSDTPDAFVNNVPYLALEFISPNGKELTKFYPLQYLIEKGDKIVNGKTVQVHPDVFDNNYINKFNQEVYDVIRKLIEKKEVFDPKNVQLVMNELPDWLTMEIEFKYMTEKYIDNYFIKGKHYDSKLATKGAKGDDDVYQFRNARVGIGTDPIEDIYVPVNVWQEENVKKALTAIYAEKTVNKYNDGVKDELNALSVDSMENIAKVIKGAELGFNNKKLKTFLNAQYRDHDCEDVVFESVVASNDIDTWYEYEKRKDETPTIVLEDMIAEDKAFIEQYIADNLKGASDVSKYWWEVSLTMDKLYTDDDAANNKIESVIDVFTVASEELKVRTVLMIYHEGDSRYVAEHKDAIWAGDNNMYAREEQIVKTFDEAYQAMMNSDFPRVESRQCVLRAQLGPNGANTAPQYLFGNVHTQLYVDAQTGEVSNENPVFPPYEPEGLAGTFEDVRAEHKQYANNYYGKNDWCEGNGSFMEFMDEKLDATDLYEVSNVFKTEDGTFCEVTENNEDGKSIEEVEGSFNVMPEVELLTLEDAINAVWVNSDMTPPYRKPHSEKFSLYFNGEVPVYKFGVNSDCIIINAITGEVLEVIEPLNP